MWRSGRTCTNALPVVALESELVLVIDPSPLLRGEVNGLQYWNAPITFDPLLKYALHTRAEDDGGRDGVRAGEGGDDGGGERAPPP